MKLDIYNVHFDFANQSYENHEKSFLYNKWEKELKGAVLFFQ
jgi:hypothetical protein